MLWRRFQHAAQCLIEWYWRFLPFFLQCVLGGLLLDNLRWDSIVDRITIDDFFHFKHRLIFAAISALLQEKTSADFITVSERLERTGDLDAAGGLAYLGTLANNTPSAHNILAYAEIVREHALRRAIAQAATDVATAAAQASDRGRGRRSRPAAWRAA